MADYGVLFDIDWDDFNGVDKRPVEIGILNMTGQKLKLKSNDTKIKHGKIQYDQTKAFGHKLDKDRKGKNPPSHIKAVPSPLPGVCGDKIMSEDCLEALEIPAFIATNKDNAYIGPKGSVTYEAEDESFKITLEWNHPFNSATSSYRSKIDPEGANVKAHFDGSNEGHKQTILFHIESA
jgi:hypothetical protein